MQARAALAQLDERESKGIETCTACPKLCRWACPVAETEMRETVSPHALVVLSGLVKKTIASPETAGDLPYHCTHCLACTEACLHKNDVPLMMSLARSRVHAPPRVSELRGHFGVAGNPQGTALDGVLARVSEESDVALSRAGKQIYFPGCETLASFPEASTAFLRASLLFGLSGVSVTPLSASCCGAALFFAGDIEGFRMHAERFAQQLRDVETLIVHDAACAHAMKKRYSDVGVELRTNILHVAEFLADKIGAPRSHAKSDGEDAIAYADTCSLARGLGVVEEPRAILKKLFEGGAVELPGLKGHEADCCGAGGLLPLTAPATARAMGEARITAFRETGAEELALFSPRCAAHLRSIEPSLRVVDVAMLLARL